MTLHFTIPGKPQGKGRPKFVRTGQFVRTYTPEQTVSYEALIQHYAMQAGAQPSTLPVEIRIVAYYDIPKSKPKKYVMQALAGDIVPQK